MSLTLDQRVFLLEKSVRDINRKLDGRGLFVPNRRVSVNLGSVKPPSAPMRSKRPTASKKKRSKRTKRRSKKRSKIR